MKEKFLKWSENVANHRHALRTLFILSFIESSLSPFPVYFLIFFMLSHKVKYTWQKVAAVASISSVLGGVFGYIIGFYFYKLIGIPLLEFYNFTESFNNFGVALKENTIWILFIASLIPALPYKIITIGSGVFAINFWLFLIISILSRSVKYILTSYVTVKMGPKMKEAMSESIWSTVATFVIILFLIYYFLIR